MDMPARETGPRLYCVWESSRCIPALRKAVSIIAMLHKWAFRSRFRANAFGWRSDLPIKRIREAISEIRKGRARRKDAVLAADGAVLLLEKLSPSLMQVDSSSGAIGTAVNNAIATLVPIIAYETADDPFADWFLEKTYQAMHLVLHVFELQREYRFHAVTREDARAANAKWNKAVAEMGSPPPEISAGRRPRASPRISAGSAEAETAEPTEEVAD